MKEYEKNLKVILDVYKTTTFRMFSSNGLNITQTQLGYLAAKGLITIEQHDGNSCDYRIIVEDKALTYFDDKAGRVKELLAKSILLPTIVAFITTVLTNYIVPMLPQILKWINHILVETFS